MSNSVLETSSASWLAPFLLLNMREQDRYGHELAGRMADLGLEATHPEAMSRFLQQMEREGMIVSECDGSDYRLPQRRYSITEMDETCLEF